MLDAPTATFTPSTVTPPRRALSTAGAMAALVRNPLESWHEELFELPSRRLAFLGTDYLQIMDPALMQSVLLDDIDSFRKSPVQQRVVRPGVGDGLLVVEGETWRFQRRAAAPAFRHDAMASLVPAMAAAGEAAADRMLAGAASGQAVDVLPEMTRATFDVIAATLLGGDDPSFDQEAVADAVTGYIETIGAVHLLDLLGAPDWIPRPGARRGKRAIAALRGAADAALANRRARVEGGGDLGDDLLGRMLAARDPETGRGMSDVELRDNIVTFIGAGHETTALALTWSLYLLAGDEAAQERLAAEASAVAGDGPIAPEQVERLAFHEQVIKEAMRLYPPAVMVQRQAVKPVRVGWHDLEPGAEVMCLIYVMHRSRRLWEKPAAFDPDRFSPERAAGRHRFAHMPFGAGPRICIGMRFAYLEAAAILAAVMRKARVGLLPDYVARPRMRVTLRPEGGMPLVIQPR
jgi:cytochrome P450